MQFQRTVVVAAFVVCLHCEPAPAGDAQHASGGEPAQWRALALDRALETTATIEDPYRHAEALASVARLQAPMGDPTATNRTIHQALAVARQVSEPAFRGWVLHDIVLAQIAVEDLHGARETAGLIEAARPHGAALAALADIQLRGGNLTAAQTTAMQIRDPGARGAVLRQVVVVQASHGEITAARSVLGLIKDPSQQTLARGDVAVAEVRAGNIEPALELAARARRKHRAEVYGRIALARVAAGDRRGGAETLQKIDDVMYRAVVQGRIAASRAEAGSRDAARQLFTSAITTVENAASAERKALTLAQLARMQAAAGERAAARETLGRARLEADRLSQGEERDDVMDYIARGQVRAGDVSGALDSARRVNDRIARALLVRDVVTLQYDATSASASASAARFDDPLIAAAAQFGVLGVQLLRKGEAPSVQTIEAARAAIREIDDPQLKPAAFAALAAAQVRSGDVEASDTAFREALIAAESLERADQRVAAYVRIVQALNERLVFLGQPAKAVHPDEAAIPDARSKS
jgi:tetratricopeptide (TPR) repeat protein